MKTNTIQLATFSRQTRPASTRDGCNVTYRGRETSEVQIESYADLLRAMAVHQVGGWTYDGIVEGRDLLLLS